jgi:zinc transporter ZupT
MKRIVLAFLVAPLVPLLLLALVDVIGSPEGSRHSENGTLFAIIVFLYVYPATAMLGIPVFLLFRRKGWYEWWRALIGGVCIGIAPSLLSLLLVVFVETNARELVATVVPFAGLGAAFGAIGALAFRAIAFPLRVDARAP